MNTKDPIRSTARPWIIENDFCHCTLHPKGAAISRLIYKPMDCDVLLGFQDDATRNTPGHYMNTIAGPVANRIGGARFSLNAQEYTLDANEADNTLHGGRIGLSEVIWQVKRHNSTSLEFQYRMPDMHMGFPGPIDCSVCYHLEQAALVIRIKATAPKSVAINMTPHIYWNLCGSGDTATQTLHVNAAEYLEVDDAKIPTGNIASVQNTSLDFQRESKIADRVFDHHLCVPGTGMRPFLTLSAPNGLSMIMHSNQPGVQIYDGRHFGTTGWKGTDGKALCHRAGIAIEPQGYPDAPNHSHFPSVFLDPNTGYLNQSCYYFSHSSSSPAK